MLAVKKNEDGYVYAVAEYRIVNQDTTPNELGEYCYCKELWVHPKYERKGVVKEIITKERLKYPNLKYLYFKRTKYGGRMKTIKLERIHV